MTRALILHLLFILAPVTFASRPHKPVPCFTRVAEVYVDPLHEERLRVDGVKVTGTTRYPIELVLRNLFLNEAGVDALKDERVLLVAEGFGALLPFLLDRGFSKVEAVDLAYHQSTYVPYPGNRKDHQTGYAG